MACQVLLARRVGEQLRDVPPQRRGYLAGIVTLLRVDPSVGTAAFPVVAGPNYHTVVFPDGRGLLDYAVVEERRLVVLVDLTWP